MKVLQFHPICLGLLNFSYSLKLKHFLKKLHQVIDDGLRVVITWETRNVRFLFPLQGKHDYQSCVICKRDFSCGLHYIGETKCTSEFRWNEHNNRTKVSEPLKHLQNNIDHYFTKTTISNVPKNVKTRST